MRVVPDLDGLLASALGTVVRALAVVLGLALGLALLVAGGMVACSLGGVLLGAGLSLLGRHD